MKLFANVLTEVQQLIQSCRDKLYRSLEVADSPLEDHLRTIRYLLDLDATVHPVWHMVTRHQKTFIASMQSYSDSYRQKVASIKQAQTRESGWNVEERESTIRQNDMVDEDAALISNTAAKLVKQLCKLISSRVPVLWRLAIGYLQGKFTGGGDPVTHTESEFEQLVIELLYVFDKMVRSVMNLNSEQSTSDAMLPSDMRDCVVLLAATLKDLGSLGMRETCTQPLSTLLEDARTVLVQAACNRAKEEILMLVNTVSRLSQVATLADRFHTIVTAMLQGI